MSDKGITLEGLAAAVDALRQELATWKALAHKQDQLSADQITATQSGATAAKISQIAVNTAAIQSLAAQVAGQISLEYVTTLPATGEPLTLYLVPQGDGTAPNFCNEYLWVNNAWELIGTTGAMANNGELTIQVNGAAVGTFTANQAANGAINITVPTNTNQLVNGAQYVDAAALQTALALKQNSLNTAQLEAVNSGITAAAVQQIADNATAISGKQDALTTAQQAAVDSGATVAKIDQIAANASAIVSLTSSKQDALSTTQLAAVNSGVTAAAVQQIGTNASNISGLQTAVSGKAADNAVVHLAGAETVTGDKTFTGATATHNITPETDNAYSLGSSSYQWASVYAQSYYYNGAAWGLDKDNTWTQTQTFQSNINLTNTSYTTGTIPSTTAISACYFAGASNSQFGYCRAIVYKTTGQTSAVLTARNRFTNGALSPTGTYVNATFTVNLDADGTGWIQFEDCSIKNDLIPYTTDTYNIGTSTKKWKTLNGINPGALSLPGNAADRIDISGSLVNLDGTSNPYTPPVPGWLCIRVNGTAGNYIYIQQGSGGLFTRVDATGAGSHIYLIMPVLSGIVATIQIVAQSGLIARLYPCLGNV